nr:beta-1,3-galactosyltransferase 5-like [Crassostrea gigas]
MRLCSVRQTFRKSNSILLVLIPLLFWLVFQVQHPLIVKISALFSNHRPLQNVHTDLSLRGRPRRGCPIFLNATHIIRFSGVEEVKEDGVLFKCKPPLNITDVRKKKLKFMVSLYPLELNFDELIKVRLEGRKIINEPINSHDFSYIHTGVNVCDGSSIYLLLVIKSSAGNFRNRQTIRNTWGNVDNYEGVRRVFLLGYNHGVQKQVDIEALEHGDIVQEDFWDHYSNITFKTIMGINWVAQYCPKAKFSFYVDDDVFLILNNLKKLRKSTLRESGLMLGKVFFFSTPFRDKTSKWFVTWEDYPFVNYPNYLAGFAYLMTADVVKRFSLAIPYIQPIPIDDTYLGIVAKKLRIPVKNQYGFAMFHPTWVSFFVPKLSFRKTIAFHRMSSPETMMRTWIEYCKQYQAVCRN